MDESFHIERDFLSGSYARHTKTKPLKDVDIVCVLGPEEDKYRKKGPKALLDDVAKALAAKYGWDQVVVQRRSVDVTFGDDEEEAVMSFDVVPVYDVGEHYEVPDTKSSERWIKTDPEVHKQKATDKHQAYSQEWKGLVRMVKTWNRHQDEPVKPSFLLTVILAAITAMS